MNLKEIREIINLMNENDLAEIEIERDGTKIKLRKSSTGVVEMVSKRPVAEMVQPAVAAPAAEGSSKAASANTKEITSPMVGTFYRAPSPESAPYVEVGDIVEVNQIVCIVEAMKLMNEIKSEIRGKVVEILAENAQPIEFGQTMFRIEPA